MATAATATTATAVTAATATGTSRSVFATAPCYVSTAAPCSGTHSRVRVGCSRPLASTRALHRR